MGRKKGRGYGSGEDGVVDDDDNDVRIGNFKGIEMELENVGRPWIPLMCIGLVACASLVLSIVALSLVVART